MHDRPAVVLAAGIGSRLHGEGEATSNKPLIDLLGVPLLFRTLRSLELAGCTRAVLVLGHNADLVRGRVQQTYSGSMALEYVLNEQYLLKNGLSALCARPLVQDEFVLTMADHVLDDRFMALVRENRPRPGGATLCVDYKLDTIFDMDDVTKVVEEGGRLLHIGKELASFNCVDTGVFLATTALLDAIEQVYEQTGDASLSEGVQALADRGGMRVLDIGECYWQDVDTPEMLEHAQQMLARHGQQSSEG